MYGSSGKFNRGGGRGGGGSGGKRNSQAGFHPPTMNRPSSASGRPSSSGGGAAAPRNRTISASGPSSSAPSSFAAREENYSLVTSNPLNFAMTIRLAPNLVEEIKRVEAEGGMARIKFDGNINNPVGNIISVGGKEFRFTWSPETGDLCDIYEERQSGEDGNGLLVESGSAWRKLNVQRVLDESTKNHVKLRSEEAEKKLKSRKAIVLDHGNPSTKSQIKALAAAESNPWRNFKAKKEQPPPAKSRPIDLMSDGFPSGGPSKSLQKSGLNETPPSKARGPTSSPAFAPEQLDASASPFRSRNIAKGHSYTENMSTPDMNRALDYDEDTAGRMVNNFVQEKAGIKGSKSNQPSDLRTVLISLLMENSSKGMSLKALEKAAEDAIPSSARHIEPILKKIATLQAPGKYFLKPGVDIESLKKPFSERQSSPEGSLHSLSENGKKYDPPDASDLTLPIKTDRVEYQNTQFRSEPEDAPDIDALHADLFGDKKDSDNNNQSGSDSDSDSDSDSSESGSHSRSKSRSVAGSGSGSSSDSESDASSKEASDVDVDIMTSDDNDEKHQKMQASGLVLPKSLTGEPGLIEVAEREDDNSMIDIEKEDLLPPERVDEPVSISDSLHKNVGRDHVEEERPDFSSERDPLYKGGFNHKLSETSKKVSGGKSKRAFDEKKFDSKPDNKRVKKATSIESRQNPSDRPSEDSYWSSSSLMENTLSRDGNAGIGSQSDFDKVISRKSMSDTQNLESVNNPGVKAKNSATRERSSSGKQSENLTRNVKNPDKSLRTPQSSTSRKVKISGETKEDQLTGSAKSSKRAPSVDSYQRSVLSAQTAAYPPLKDDEAKSASGNGGRPRVLHRELSDLELGELREPPLPEDTSGYKRQAERKSLSKPTENKSFGFDTGKLKPPGNIVNPAPINSVVRPIRPHQPRGDQTDIVMQSNRGLEMGSKHEDAERSADTTPEVNGKPHGKLLANVPKEHGVGNGILPPKKESGKLKPNILLPDLNNKQKDASLTESNDSSQRRRESSSDESSCPYSKYEKDEPQLKGSIRDSSEYSEYVKEYQEKYDIYVSLNSVIESSREKFLKYQREITESEMKDTERYHKLIRQIKQSFDQSVERHKRLKKIFYILHEELANLKQKIKEFAVPYLTKQ